jgi:predicted hydrocarbon binding protein
MVRSSIKNRGSKLDNVRRIAACKFPEEIEGSGMPLGDIETEFLLTLIESLIRCRVHRNELGARRDRFC